MGVSEKRSSAIGRGVREHVLVKVPSLVVHLLCCSTAQHRLTHDRNRGGSTTGEPDEESTGYEGEYIYDDG